MKKISFESAPWWTSTLYVIGEEKMPLLVIDNFHPTPDMLLQDAKQQTFVANAPYFPGVRSPVPETYFQPVIDALKDVLKNIFLYEKGVKLEESYFSLTTTAKEDLNMVQRLPHIDGGNDMKIALLHYLCGPKHGGTAFYRQCRTGFETVPSARFNDYTLAVGEDHKKLGAPQAKYFEDSDMRFEQIHKVDAKFNRAVLYFGLNLHSVLPGVEPLTQNPQTGRLTVNTFLSPI